MATPLTSDFPELSHLSREDLEDLLANPTYFQAVFHSLQRVQDLYQAQAELGSANEQIANSTLALQNELYQLRQETLDAFNQAKSLEVKWQDLDRQQKEQHQRYTPSFLHMRLRHSLTAQDDLSEARATSFVQGPSTNHDSSAVTGREVEEFVKDFKELRKTYHKRAMWSERWQAGDVTWPEDPVS